MRQTVYSNANILLNTTKNIEKNPFACDTDQCVGVKVKCLTWGAGEHILGQIPHCMEQNSSQMPGVCTGAGRGG